LIVDDNSSDETAQVVKNYKDPRIKYFLHKDNLGAAAARNTGLRNALGEFITFLDDDDEWALEKIFKQIEVFKNTSRTMGLVFTNGYSEYENDYFIKEKKTFGIIYDPKKDHFFPLGILIPPSSSWMLPRIIMDEIGCFDEKMRHWDDGDYLVKVANKYPIYFLNENLVTWHASEVHLETVSQTLIKAKEIFLKKNYALIKKDRKYFFGFCRTLGKDAMSIDKPMARKYLFKALLMRPWDFSIINKLVKIF
jgi:glycosyltransferase involved in cell wall biosynthesis